MALLNNNFFGEICGRNVYSFLGDLDYDLTTSTERINHLKKILHTENGYPHPFFERVFEQTQDEDTGLNTSYIKLILNSTDTLYTDSNVCDVLRKMADYVLFTKEGRELNRSNLTQYKIYKDARMFEKIQKELSLEAELERVAGSAEDDGDIDTLIHILVKDTNYRKDKGTKITPDDFNDPELGHIIRGYQNQINYMRDKLEKNKEEIYLIENIDRLTEEEQERFNQIYPNLHQNTNLRDRKVQLIRESKSLATHIHSMRQDMLDCKEMIKRPIVFKSLLDGHPEPDLSPVDVIFVKEELDIEAYQEKAKQHMEFYKSLIDQYKEQIEINKANEKTYYGFVKKIEFFEALYKDVKKIVEAETEKEILEIRQKQYINAVRELMLTPEKDVYDLQDDFEILLFMVNEALKITNLSEIEVETVNLCRAGMEQEAVAEIISEKYNTKNYAMKVNRTLFTVANKVYNVLQESFKQYKIGNKHQKSTTKVCEVCGQEKLIEDFHKDNKNADGYRKECKLCRKKKRENKQQ